MARAKETTNDLYRSAEILIRQFEAVISKIKRVSLATAKKASNAAAPSISAAGESEAPHNNARQQKQQLTGLLENYFQREHQTMKIPQRSHRDLQKQKTIHHQMLQSPQQKWQLDQQHSPLAGYNRRVQIKPSELKLILKLEKSIAANGTLIVRPSIKVDGSTYLTESRAPNTVSEGEQVYGDDSTEARCDTGISAKICHGFGFGFGGSLKQQLEQRTHQQQQQQQQPVLLRSELRKNSPTYLSFNKARQTNNHHDDVESDSVSFFDDSFSDCSDAEGKSS